MRERMLLPMSGDLHAIAIGRIVRARSPHRRTGHSRSNGTASHSPTSRPIVLRFFQYEVNTRNAEALDTLELFHTEQ
jgi:hypothetical protein